MRRHIAVIHKSSLFTGAVILLVLFLLSACGAHPEQAPELPADSAEPSKAPPEETVKTEFTREELLEDYDQLWDTIEENYPFLPVLEEHGIDCAQLREHYREELSSCSDDLQGFAALLRRMFRQMENLAHLGLAEEDVVWTYVDSQSMPWYELAAAPQTQASYAQLSQGKEYDAEAEYPEVKTNYFPDCQAAYFHFPSFDYFLTKRDSTVIADYLSTLDGVEHVIIDITGNSGGSTDSIYQNIIEPLGGEASWTTYSFFAESPLTEKFIISGREDRVKPLSELPEDAVYPEFAERLGMTHFIADTYILPGDNPGCAPGAKRWLLVDKFVYSSSESFARFCKDTGWAALVGTRTAGDGDNFASVMFSLGSTGLLVRFSTTSSANADGSLNSEAGTMPDYLCIKGQTPLSKCLELIRSNSQP